LFKIKRRKGEDCFFRTFEATFCGQSGVDTPVHGLIHQALVLHVNFKKVHSFSHRELLQAQVQEREGGIDGNAAEEERRKK